jgi:hypothetical protein
MGVRGQLREAVCRPALTILAVVALWALVARPVSAGPITLAWDPNPEPYITGYRVFVGTAPGVYTQTFDVPTNQTTFTFTSASSGVRYYFAVAAQADAVYSPNSYEISADGGSATRSASSGGQQSPIGTGTGAASATALTARCRTGCVTTIASGTADVSSLNVLSGGALLYVENGTRVVARSVSGGQTMSLLEAATDQTFVQAVPDPRFQENGLTYVSSVRARNDEMFELDIVRHRYLAGGLGEPSTVLAGIAVPRNLTARFTVSDGGQLYVAAPAAGSRRDLYAASVLLFDADGRTPAGRTTPVLSDGMAAPSAMVWDSRRRRALLAGRAATGASGIRLLRAAGTDSTAVSLDERTVAALKDATSGNSVTDLAISPDAGALAIASGSDLILLDLDTLAVQRTNLETWGTPVAVAIGAAGERYVAVRRRVEDGGGSLLLRIADDTAADAR